MIGLGKIFVLAAVVSGALGAAPAALAVESAAWLPAKAPNVVVRWVDEDGTVEVVHGGELATQWVWTPGDPDRRKSPLDPPDPRRYPGAPAIQVRFQTRAVPAGWRPATANVDGADLMGFDRAGGNDPRLWNVVVALRSELATLSLDFTEGKKPHHLTLLLSTSERLPEIIVHKSCASLFKIEAANANTKKMNVDPVIGSALFGAAIGVGMAGAKAADEAVAAATAHHLYLGLACLFDDDAVYFHLARSEDAHWAYAAPATAARPEQPDRIDTSGAHFLYRVYREDKRLEDHNVILELRTRDARERLLSTGLVCVNNGAMCRRNPKWIDD